MKLKEQEVEKEGMNKELYDLFIKVIQFECNKMSFLKGAKFYCWAHGLQKHSKFFKIMMECCSKCKNEFIYYLLAHFEEVPELKIDAIKTEYESVESVFVDFAEREDEYVTLLETITKKAKELDDINAFAFLLPMLNKIDHIACRALEAIKNDQNPMDLLPECCESYVSR